MIASRPLVNSPPLLLLLSPDRQLPMPPRSIVVFPLSTELDVTKLAVGRTLILLTPPRSSRLVELKSSRELTLALNKLTCIGPLKPSVQTLKTEFSMVKLLGSLITPIVWHFTA